MDKIDFFIWLPFVIIAIIDFVWYMSLTKRQKIHNDANAAAIFTLGLVGSFVVWCFREIYRQKGWEYFKFEIANHTVFAVIFGTIGALFVFALLGVFFILKTNQK